MGVIHQEKINRFVNKAVKTSGNDSNTEKIVNIIGSLPLSYDECQKLSQSSNFDIAQAARDKIEKRYLDAGSTLVEAVETLSRHNMYDRLREQGYTSKEIKSMEFPTDGSEPIEPIEEDVNKITLENVLAWMDLAADTGYYEFIQKAHVYKTIGEPGQPSSAVIAQ